MNKEKRKLIFEKKKYMYCKYHENKYMKTATHGLTRVEHGSVLIFMIFEVPKVLLVRPSSFGRAGEPS